MAGPRGPSPVTDARPPGSSRPCLDRRGWMTDSEECTGWPRGCIWRVSSPSCPQSCCKMGANVHAWTAGTYPGLLTGSVGSGHVLRLVQVSFSHPLSCFSLMLSWDHAEKWVKRCVVLSCLHSGSFTERTAKGSLACRFGEKSGSVMV